MLGGITLLIILILQRFTKGFLKSIAILIGLAIGTALAGIFEWLISNKWAMHIGLDSLFHSDFLVLALM